MSRYHGAVNTESVIQESANDLLDVFFAHFVKERGSVNVFCELRFGAVIRLDVGVRLMLWDMRRWVLKSCESVGYVFKHGDVDSEACVVLVKVHAQVLLTFPFQFAFVMFVEDGGKLLSMFTLLFAPKFLILRVGKKVSHFHELAGVLVEDCIVENCIEEVSGK